MRVIYIDVLMALNLFIDFLLLTVTARLLRRPRKRWRLVLGALLGAACACLIFLPAMPALLSMLVKLAAAALIVKVSFAWAGPLGYLKELVTFFVAGTLFAGMAYAFWFFAAPEGFYVVNGVVYYDVSPLMLVALTVLSYGVLWLYDRLTRQKAPEGCDYRLLVDFGEGEASLKTLYDTGNHLTEAFSGSPVAVVCTEAVKAVLPAALAAQAAGLSDAAASGEALSAAPGGLRLIPYRSVGGNGLLPAFRPRKMLLINGRGAGRDVTGAYVALTSALGRGDYEALIGCELAGVFDTPAGRWSQEDAERAEKCHEHTEEISLR